MSIKNNNNEVLDPFSRKRNEWDLLLELQGLLEEYGVCSIEPINYNENSEPTLVLLLNSFEYLVEEAELEQVFSILKEESGIKIMVNEDGELELFHPENVEEYNDDLPF